jgi:hypothetical protein
MNSIRVTGQFEGTHHWPEAPDEVAHLRNLHAHIFKARVEIQADHDNRAVEFFIAKKCLLRACDYVSKLLVKTPTMSCEQMAERIAAYMHDCKEYVILEVIVEEPEIGEGIFRPSPTPHIIGGTAFTREQIDEMQRGGKFVKAV